MPIHVAIVSALLGCAISVAVAAQDECDPEATVEPRCEGAADDADAASGMSQSEGEDLVADNEASDDGDPEAPSATAESDGGDGEQAATESYGADDGEADPDASEADDAEPVDAQDTDSAEDAAPDANPEGVADDPEGGQASDGEGDAAAGQAQVDADGATDKDADESTGNWSVLVDGIRIATNPKEVNALFAAHGTVIDVGRRYVMEVRNGGTKQQRSYLVVTMSRQREAQAVIEALDGFTGFGTEKLRARACGEAWESGDEPRVPAIEC